MTNEDVKLVAGHTVAIFGCDGFIGKHLCKYIEDNHGIVIRVGRDRWNLLARTPITAKKHLKNCTLAINVSGVNGSVEFNRNYPARIFYENTIMGMHAMYSLMKYDFPLLTVLSSCGYPETLSASPLQEATYLQASPNAGAAAQGYAKRNLLLCSNFFNQQYKTNFKTCVIPTIYGPGDSFDEKKSKVVGGMIHRFWQAKQSNVASLAMWGSPDTLREFMFVEDLPRQLVRTALLHGTNGEQLDPLNIASDQEIKMSELAKLIMDVMDYNPILIWGKTKAGQLRKKLDNTNTKRVLGNLRLTKLPTGIRKTVEFYKCKN